MGREADMRRMVGVVAGLLAVTGPVLAQGSHPLDGVWVGSYTCLQGRTPLELYVVTDDEGVPRAYFHFGTGSRALPEGCFTMTGTAAKGRIAFVAEDWRLRPENYVPVNLDGTVSGTRYGGSVLGPGCTTFSLQQREPAPLPAACRKRSSQVS